MAFAHVAVAAIAWATESASPMAITALIIIAHVYWAAHLVSVKLATNPPPTEDQSDAGN
jgi:hypothetical protein